MGDLVATGHLWSGGGGQITLMPVAGLLLTACLARWSLGRVSPAMLAASVVLGTLFAVAADEWGLTVTMAAWIVGALVFAGHGRDVRSILGRNPSD
jgi:hypothetical protein